MGRLLFGTTLMWLLMVIISFSWNYWDSQQEQRKIALQVARGFFQHILITRSWNARHGGVYVPVTEETQPNPYLDDTDLRDIKVNDQLTLTKITPAFMTRQIAALAARDQQDIQYHITSLSPLRPDNFASELETKTLFALAAGQSDLGQIITINKQPKFFYMASLRAEKPCLTCHSKQGFKEGDRLGGISVTMPFTKSAALQPLLFGHLAIALFGLLAISAAGRKLNAAYITIKNQSDTDFLTGLANRRAIMANLHQGIKVARREHNTLALLVMDLDRFKNVNDSFGHPSGDKLLQMIARQLKDNLREVDTIARLGGDEFALLLNNISDPHDAIVVANKILQLFKQDWQLADNIEVHLGASIGISLFPTHGDNADLLLQYADTALYRSKSKGRGRFYLFTKDLSVAAAQRTRLEKDLRAAVLNKELVVFFQPIYNIVDGHIDGAETLLRWHHPAEGIVPADKFIPLAEETGLIQEIDTWVLTESCKQGRIWLDQGLDLNSLAVNISAYQIHHGDFSSTVKNILDTTGFPAECLIFEIKETILIQRELESSQILSTLRKMGIRLAIDNFGTGYSSLPHLQQLPIDILKIDQRFIHQLSGTPENDAVTTAIIQMGHTLGCKVVAEGVETHQHLSILQAHGCDFYQGFLSSPALPAWKLGKVLRNNKICDSELL